MENNEKNIPKLRFPGFEGEWEVKKLGEILKIGNGKDYKHLEEGNIPVYGSGGYMCSVNDYLYDGDSVCIGRKGTIDKPILLHGKFWTVDTLFYTYGYKDCLPFFIFLLFQNINWKKHNEAGGVPSLNKKNIENIQVLLPTLPEQQKIASCLSSVDDMITGSQKRLEALKEHKRGLMQQLFPQEGETVPKLRFPGFEGDWEAKKLGDVCKISSGKSIPANEIIDSPKNNYYPCYGGNGLRGYVKNFMYDGCFPIIGRVGAQCGNIHLTNGKFCATEHALVVTISANTSPNFMSYLLETMSLNQYAKGAAQPVISASSLCELKNAFPTLPEQEKIASCLTAIDKLIAAQQERIEALKQHKRGLMQQLFPTVTNE